MIDKKEKKYQTTIKEKIKSLLICIAFVLAFILVVGSPIFIILDQSLGESEITTHQSQIINKEITKSYQKIGKYGHRWVKHYHLIIDDAGDFEIAERDYNAAVIGDMVTWSHITKTGKWTNWKYERNELGS